MKSCAIVVLCLQETRIPWFGTQIEDNGYTLITAGHDKDERSFAGVGFLIAPWLTQSVFSFKPVSDRLCCLKLRARGGKAAIICAYAPHNGHEYNIRQFFSRTLQSWSTRLPCMAPRLCLEISMPGYTTVLVARTRFLDLIALVIRHTIRKCTQVPLLSCRTKLSDRSPFAI